MNPSFIAHAAAPEDPQARRALTEFMRAEFESPAAAMADLIGRAVDDARSAGLSIYFDDLSHMRSCAFKFAARVAEQLDFPLAAVAVPQKIAAASLRHDLRTPITAIIGYAELMAEEARDQGHAAMLGSMADVLTASKHLLDNIDRLVDYSSSRDSEILETGPADSVLVQARDVLRQLVESDPIERASAVGHILIVDDTVTILEPLGRRLSRDGHDVITCESGEEALEIVSQHTFDVVLLDVMMPGMSGIEVLRKLKADYPDLPVIMISALDEMDMIVRCLEEGAEDYLSKPVNATLLKARITASLDRKFLRDREKAVQAKLRLEQKRSDKLLRNVLPNVIVERLRRGEAEIADHFDSVTILFCDLVGFTHLAADWPAAKTLTLLNEIFSGFDELVTRFGLEKIKTIGDAYMVAGGLPQPTLDHAAATAAMALEMPGLVERAAARSRTNLACRIGLNTGPAVAGIVGAQKFFYDVWGDTVNTASRMESSSVPGRIQLSQATYDALAGQFECQKRGVVDIKGKGRMVTYFLLAKRSA